MRFLFGSLFVIFMLFVNYIEILSGMNPNWNKTKTLRLFGQSLEVSEDPAELPGMKRRRKGSKSLRLASNGEIKIFNEHTKCFEEEPLPTSRSYKRRANHRVPVAYVHTPISEHPNFYDNHPHLDPKDLVGLEAYQLFQKYYANHPLPPQSAQNAAYDYYQENYNTYHQPPNFKGHPGASGSINDQH